jgi:hypothetical protein
MRHAITIQRRALLGALALALLLGGLLVAIPTAHAQPLPGDICELDGLYDSQVIGPLSPDPNLPNQTVTTTFVIDGHTVTQTFTITNLGGGYYQFTISITVSGCEPTRTEQPAPAVFLSEVCEPNDGFSDDGWMTWDTDKPGATLYYAASADGPWLSLETNGPPYVLSQADLNALAQAAGLSDYHDLWFKANDRGYPVNVGDAIRNRAAHMDDICAGE